MTTAAAVLLGLWGLTAAATTIVDAWWYLKGWRRAE